MTKTLFSEMNLNDEIERALTVMGFETPTPIQEKAIPLIRTGVDVTARSQTGTGKTIAFSIPAIEKIEINDKKPSIQVLIICPTRELAQQADEEIKKLTRYKQEIRSVAIYGGAPIDRQCIALRKAYIVVGTPGRIMDHMRRKSIKLNNLKMVVLDEADEMLNMGFKEDIETILTDTPEDRQTLLFSATMPPVIMKITKSFQKNPKLIEIDKSQVTLGNIKQQYIDVPHSRKKESLNLLMQYYRPKRTIIFCSTKRMADELTEYMNDLGIRAESIHSDIKQTQRTNTMNAFKLGKFDILIATDIAARGIDVNDIEYVINFDIPSNSEYYVHRIGRTGRAGKEGCSITICCSKREICELRHIAQKTKSEITELSLPTSDDIRVAYITRASNELEGLLMGKTDPLFVEMVKMLTDKGYPPESIAAATLALHYGDLGKVAVNPSLHQYRHEAERSVRGKAREKRKYNKDGCGSKSGFTKISLDSNSMDKNNIYETLYINAGTQSRIRPNNIVGAITEYADVSGKEIGKISVTADYSLVEVPKDKTDEILEALNGCKICGVTTMSSRLSQKRIHSGTKNKGNKAQYGNRFNKQKSKNSRI